MADPVAAAERSEELSVQSASGAVIDILQAGAARLESRLLEQTIDALRVATRHLAINDHGDPFLERQFGASGLRHLFFKCARHALQAQGLQLGQAVMGKHETPFVAQW
jgi:hypothetical protein